MRPMIGLTPPPRHARPRGSSLRARGGPAHLAAAMDAEKPDSLADEEGERVAKALARAGVASRREVERLIAAGRVVLNGETLTTPAVLVKAGDVLAVDGKTVQAAEPTRVFRYHKP